jgi:hypothetical protein
MSIWGFIFVLVAAIVFLIYAWLTPGISKVAGLGLALLSIGIIFTFATTSNPVHF